MTAFDCIVSYELVDFCEDDMHLSKSRLAVSYCIQDWNGIVKCEDRIKIPLDIVECVELSYRARANASPI